jgi:hypothetical protein
MGRRRGQPQVGGAVWELRSAYVLLISDMLAKDYARAFASLWQWAKTS